MEVRNLTPYEPQPGTQLSPAAPPAYRGPGAVPVGQPSLWQQWQPTIWDYWPILVKHRWTLLASIVVFVVMATIISLRTTPVYEAVGRIAINHESSDASLGLKTAGGIADEDYGDDYLVAIDTQVQILRSDALALQVVKQLQADHNYGFGTAPAVNNAVTAAPAVDTRQEAAILGTFHSGLKISVVPRTRIVELHYLSPDPQVAANVVNTLANVYIEQNYKSKFEATMRTSEWLSRQLSDLQVKVEASQEKLVRYQKEHDILGIDEKQNIITSKLDELNKELTEAEADRIAKQARARSLGEGADVASDVNSLMEKLRSQEADLKAQLAQLTTQFGPSYPKVVELNRQLAQVEASIARERTALARRAQNEYQMALGREQLLRGALEKQKQEANGLNESAVEYYQLKRDADANRQLYDGLLQKLKEAGVAAGLHSSNVSIIDPARVPLVPVKPNLRRNIGMGLLFGGIFGVGLVFMLQAVDNTLRTAEQVEIVSGLPTLGVIPLGLSGRGYGLAYGYGRRRRKELLAATSKTQVSSVASLRPKSEMAESYRALRTSVLLSAAGAPPRILLVTSALPQEGKTTTAVNTAIVLAQRGSRVLLVDADMRRPSIHRTLGLECTPGLSTVLTGSATTDAVVVPFPKIPNLTVLRAGTPPPHPAELLGSEVMKSALAQWREQYDHVVIDTPPALSVTDAVLLSVDVDAALVVIRAAKTTKGALRRTVELLTQVNANLMGVVLNAVNLHAPDQYYYYYRGPKYSGSYYHEETVASDK